MALFKIFKGNSSNLPTNHHNGYCYFTEDDGKFYIDISDDTINVSYTQDGYFSTSHVVTAQEANTYYHVYEGNYVPFIEGEVISSKTNKYTRTETLTAYGQRMPLNADQTNRLKVGVVTSGSSATQKDVSIAGIEKLSNGITILVKNNSVSALANATLRLNNFDRKPIFKDNAVISDDTWAANELILLSYYENINNGQGAWVIMAGGSTAANIDVADKRNSLFYVSGGGQATGDWIGTCDDITSEDLNDATNSVKILYTIGIEGDNSNETRSGNRIYTMLNLNNTGYKQIYLSKNPGLASDYKPLTTEYKPGDSIILSYHYVLDDGGNDISYWLCLADKGEGETGGSDSSIAKYNTPPAGNTILPYTLCARGENNKLYSLVINGQQLDDWNPVSKTYFESGFYPSTLCFYNCDTRTEINQYIPEGTLSFEAGDYDKAIYTFSSRLKANRTIFFKGTYNKTTGLFHLSRGTTQKYYAQMPTDVTTLRLSNFDVESNSALNYNFEAGYYYIPVCITGNEAYTESHQASQINAGEFISDIPATSYKAHFLAEHPIYYCEVDATDSQKLNLVQTANRAQRLITSTADVGGISSGAGTINPTYVPTYFHNGEPTPIAYSIGVSVPSNAKFTDTKNTAGVSTLSSAMYLVGAPRTSVDLSDNSEVTHTSQYAYVQNSQLHSDDITLIKDDGNGSTENKLTMEYDENLECLNFVFHGTNS